MQKNFNKKFVFKIIIYTNMKFGFDFTKRYTVYTIPLEIKPQIIMLSQYTSEIIVSGSLPVYINIYGDSFTEDCQVIFGSMNTSSYYQNGNTMTFLIPYDLPVNSVYDVTEYPVYVMKKIYNSNNTTTFIESNKIIFSITNNI
jgi:hypothetical protein